MSQEHWAYVLVLFLAFNFLVAICLQGLIGLVVGSLVAIRGQPPKIEHNHYYAEIEEDDDDDDDDYTDLH